MKISIVGVGAMGSIYAGLFASAGNEVIGVFRNSDQASHVNKCGLRVEGASGDRIATIRATTEAPQEEMDLIVLAVKATAVAEAATAARPMVGPKTVVLALQNGVGSADLVAEALGDDRLAVGIAGGFGASMRGPGHAHHNGMEVIRIGSYSTLPWSTVERIAEAWRAAGFRCEATADILAMQWEKLICNVAYSAPCALTGMSVGQVLDDPDAGPISRAAAVEAWTIARALGVNIAVEDPIAHVRNFASRMPKSRPSLLQDVEAGRRSEIDFINGAIPREARKLGQVTPVNDLLVGLIRARERTYQSAAG
ncbi:2-dehydropantoate 2-reductase [Xanthobacter dioxanivorans]|uniref:2-dehydropantoate 2-reductase n=2 Tax=Xanthobacter dioxanivorans TaxID=2528964 RepID=A0A974SIA7_9HYPH|nr:2-dehydropantoate 2-reductase [Xanthobacter dioxanivorans]